MNKEGPLRPHELAMLSDGELLKLSETELTNLPSERLLRLYRNLQDNVAITSIERDRGPRRFDSKDSPTQVKKKTTTFQERKQDEIEGGFITLSKLTKLLETKGLAPPTMEERKL
ncbi:MAG: hypothetical protein HY397_00425 [Candidatus Doudnabacteria bacterium]|nr:hypothetical protein [Candidatus Doudnabacteria bacterium]